MKRKTIRGVRIIANRPADRVAVCSDHYDAAGNVIATLRRYPDLNVGVRQRP